MTILKWLVMGNNIIDLLLVLGPLPVVMSSSCYGVPLPVLSVWFWPRPESWLSRSRRWPMIMARCLASRAPVCTEGPPRAPKSETWRKVRTRMPKSPKVNTKKVVLYVLYSFCMYMYVHISEASRFLSSVIFIQYMCQNQSDGFFQVWRSASPRPVG